MEQDRTELKSSVKTICDTVVDIKRDTRDKLKIICDDVQGFYKARWAPVAVIMAAVMAVAGIGIKLLLDHTNNGGHPEMVTRMATVDAKLENIDKNTQIILKYTPVNGIPIGSGE